MTKAQSNRASKHRSKHRSTRRPGPRSKRASNSGSARRPAGKQRSAVECILAYDTTKVAALLSRGKKGNRRVKKGTDDNVQYFATKEFVVLAAQRRGTSVQLKARLKKGEAEDGFTVLLQSAARAFDEWDACRDDISPSYAHEYMVNDCTDVLVAFRHKEPVAFALLEKTLTKTAVGILLCVTDGGQGRGPTHNVDDPGRGAARCDGAHAVGTPERRVVLHRQRIFVWQGLRRRARPTGQRPARQHANQNGWCQRRVVVRLQRCSAAAPGAAPQERWVPDVCVILLAVFFWCCSL